MASSDGGDVQERPVYDMAHAVTYANQVLVLRPWLHPGVEKRVIAARPPRSERAPDAAVGAAQHQALEVVFGGRPLQRYRAGRDRRRTPVRRLRRQALWQLHHQ